MLSHFQLVGEFHDTFDHPQRTAPYYEVFNDNTKLLDFRLNLIKEELQEFQDAMIKNDLVEMADALCDLSYVANGACQCLGIHIDEYMFDHQLSTRTPYQSKVDKVKYVVDLDNAVNIIDSNTVFIEECIEAINSCINYYRHCYAQTHSKYNAVELKLNFHMIQHCLALILDYTYKLGHKLGFHMDLMFREVHASNMTKVCDNVEDAKLSVEAYIKEGRYTDPAYKIKNQYFVVYDRATSKILKNHKWRLPNLRQFMVPNDKIDQQIDDQSNDDDIIVQIDKHLSLNA